MTSSPSEDILDIAQRVLVEPVQAIGKVSAFELLKVVQHASEEPYWKLLNKGACQDIFFVTNFGAVPKLIGIMYDIATEAGYPASDMGIYVQPIVQGSNCHCEFNLFYNPNNQNDTDRVKELYIRTTEALMAKGAFFSRPYDETTRMVVNRNAATVAALNKVKGILDPNKIMNPEKLCY